MTEINSKNNRRMLAISVIALLATLAVWGLSPGSPLWQQSETTTEQSQTPTESGPEGLPLELPEQVLHYPLQIWTAEEIKERLDKEVAAYKKRVQETPKFFMEHAYLAAAYLQEASATGETSWYLLAEQSAQRSLALQKENPGAWQVLSRIAQARHDFAQSDSLNQKIAAVSPPNDAGVLANRVTIRMAQGRLLDAREAAQALVQQDPQLPALTQLALVQEAQGQDPAAAQSFIKGIQREQTGEGSGSAQARAWLGRIYIRHGQSELGKQLYQEALRIKPGHEISLGLMGDLALREERFAEAATHFAAAHAFNQSPLFQIKQARAEHLQGNTEAALALLIEAEGSLRRELSAESFGHRRDLALLLMDRSQLKTAGQAEPPKTEKGLALDSKEILSLMQAEAKVRQDAETMNLLARALILHQKWPEAQQAVQQALNAGAVDAELMYRAAQIESHLGAEATAEAYRQAAQKQDQGFYKSPEYRLADLPDFKKTEVPS